MKYKECARFNIKRLISLKGFSKKHISGVLSKLGIVNLCTRLKGNFGGSHRVYYVIYY